MSIEVTHVNIRLSISILIIKLLFVEILSAAIVIMFHESILMLSSTTLAELDIGVFNLPLLVLALVVKFFLTIFIIWQWLSEYYEINSDSIYHRKGVIFRMEEKYPLKHIQFVEVSQTVLGKIFNYATISIFDIRRNKYEDLYMIHNPMRYAKIIEALLPEADERKRTLREHVIERER